MANSKVAKKQGRSKRVAKALAEAPVSDEIKAAAARIGREPTMVSSYVGDVRDRIAELRKATDEIISLAVSSEPEYRSDAFQEALRLVRSVRMNLEMDVEQALNPAVAP